MGDQLLLEAGFSMSSNDLGFMDEQKLIAQTRFTGKSTG